MIGNGAKEPVEPSVKIRTEPFADVYEMRSEIGRGKYAVVKRCVHRTTGAVYAAKFLHKRRRGKDCRQDALHEIRMLHLTRMHPRIINLIEVYETTHDLVLVTEYVEGGELFQHIDVEGRVDEPTAVRLMRQILDGVAFLHGNNILHMDIKPQNILLTDSLPDGDIKLCDLGLARPFNSGDDVVEIIGTLDYVAPEVLDFVSLDAACDMWSVGVLAYVMLTGCSPFAGETRQETLLNISQVNLEFPEDLFGSISTTAVDFIRRLLIKNTRERMTAAQCLEHVWLKEEDTKDTSKPPAEATELPVAESDHKPAAKLLSPAPSPAASPSLPRCRMSSAAVIDPLSGQRRALVATLNTDEVLTSHEPTKKCRCEVDSCQSTPSECIVKANRDSKDEGNKENNTNDIRETVHHTTKKLICTEKGCVGGSGIETSFLGACLDVTVA